MEKKTGILLCSIVLGFLPLGVIFLATSSFQHKYASGTIALSEPSGSVYQSFLSVLRERNQKEEAARLFARIEAFDDNIHPYRDIISNDRYDELLAYIVSQCPEDTARLGEQKYMEMITSERMADKFLEQPLGVKVLLSAEKFQKVTAQRYLGKGLSVEAYCIQKYAHVTYQKKLSEVHTELVLSTGILRDQKNMPDRDVVFQKKNILQFIERRDNEQEENTLLVHEHGSAPEEQVVFGIDDVANPLYKLTAGEKEFAELFIAIAKEKIFKNLALLQYHNILSLEDRIRIIANIDLIIPESCYNRDAHYDFLEGNVIHEGDKMYYEYESDKRIMSYDISPVKKKTESGASGVRVYKDMEILGNNMIYKDGKIIKFTGISFSVPICNNYSNLVDFSRMMEYTILHELGHYYMHRNDPDPDEFVSLCRDEATRVCEMDAFVTSYAASSSVEDYAETFAHVVYEQLYGYFPVGILSSQKKNYFLERFASGGH